MAEISLHVKNKDTLSPLDRLFENRKGGECLGNVSEGKKLRPERCIVLDIII
jgi:hypothetical protein